MFFQGVYAIGVPLTFIYLMFFDGFIYNWWNWTIALFTSSFLSTIWPVYWVIVRPLFG